MLPRKWFFGLCPDSPDKIALALFQQNQDFLDRAASGEFPLHRRGLAGPGVPQSGNRTVGDGVDFKDRRQMGTVGAAPLPNQELSELLLNGAIRQALAGRDNPYVTLNGQIAWRFFRNSYRDLAQRLLSLYAKIGSEERESRREAARAENEADAEEQEPIVPAVRKTAAETAELQSDRHFRLER